jgi:hypothetical protein
MAFKAKYKQLLRFSAGSTADGGGGGGGYGGGGATPQNSPRQGPLPSPRGPPSPPDVEVRGSFRLLAVAAPWVFLLEEFGAVGGS